MTMSMTQVHRIKELQQKQQGPYQIAKELNLDPKTVRKYMVREDFSPKAPTPKECASKLDPFKGDIDLWILQDEKCRSKQRHTAQRVFDRLKELYPEKFDCSYPTVVRYVRACREKKKRNHKGTMELIWHPGEAQVDFGECDIIENGVLRICRYLVVSFPYSNAALVQCFGGETAECLCQGLMDIFKYIRGVPRRLVLDNATGAGRRMGDVIRLTQLFKRFQAHFGFELTFCNPASGHEKGNVENKVGFVRRNFFVPMPSVASMADWNQELIELCDLDNAREHYKKGTPICDLFKEDQLYLLNLPHYPFEACRYETVKTNGYGKFSIDGCHNYSSSPMYAEREVTVRIGAHFVEPLNEAGEPISKHLRQFGNERTDTTDWTTMLDQLISKPGAWRNSIVREQVSYPLRDYMDEQDRSGLKQVLKTMKGLSAQYGIDVTMTALQEAVTRKATKGIDINAAVLAARISSYGLDTPGEAGPDLSSYDKALLCFEGGIGHGS